MLTDEAIQDVISAYFKRPKILTDHQRLRPEKSEVERLLCDNSKLIKLGWKQKYSIQETLSTVYDDWVNRVQKHDK